MHYQDLHSESTSSPSTDQFTILISFSIFESVALMPAGVIALTFEVDTIDTSQFYDP